MLLRLNSMAFLMLLVDDQIPPAPALTYQLIRLFLKWYERFTEVLLGGMPLRHSQAMVKEPTSIARHRQAFSCNHQDSRGDTHIQSQAFNQQALTHACIVTQPEMSLQFAGISQAFYDPLHQTL